MMHQQMKVVTQMTKLKGIKHLDVRKNRTLSILTRMHSSRISAARFNGHLLRGGCPGGLPGVGGVSRGGVCLGCVCPGRCLPRGDVHPRPLHAGIHPP